jgi:uncharacterized membrane protein YgcG
VTLLLPFLLAAALPVQPPGKCVLDEAAALASAEFAALEASCEALDKSGDGQIEVVLTDDFRGDEKEEFANKLFHAWGIGHKGKNDGILVVLSPKMRKWRIEVGYGLEGRITDAQAAEIGRNLGVPAWKAAQWGAGLVAVTNAIVPLVHAEAKLRPVETPSTFPIPTWAIVLVVLGVLGIVVLLLALSARAEKKRQEAEQLEHMEQLRREHLAWEASVRRSQARAYSSSTPATKTAPKVTPTPAKPSAAPAVVAAVVVAEESPRPTYEAPSYDPPPYSSDSGGGFDGGGGDSGGGGAGGDF